LTIIIFLAHPVYGVVAVSVDSDRCKWHVQYVVSTARHCRTPLG